MPRAPKRCGHMGCEQLVRGTTYCSEHKPVGWSPIDTGRNDAGHKEFRRQVLANCKGLCEISGPGCTHRATIADHKINLAEGGDRYDPANGQGVCANCHNAKTQAEAARGRARSRGASSPSPR